MKPEDVPMAWRAALLREDPVVIGTLASHEVAELICAVAPLIAASERERCARVADAAAEKAAVDKHRFRAVASSIRALEDTP